MTGRSTRSSKRKQEDTASSPAVAKKKSKAITTSKKKAAAPKKKATTTKKKTSSPTKMFKKNKEELLTSLDAVWENVLQDDPDNPRVASMEGISKLCHHLDLDAETDLRVLVLLWKLGVSEKPGQMSRSEFEEGCDEMGVSGSIASLKALVPSLDLGFLDQEDFKKFYKVCV